MADLTPAQLERRDLRIFRGQVWPRRKLIIQSPVLIAAVPTGVVLAVVVPWLPSSALKISEATSVGFTYASISTGVCITALILALGLPGEERLAKWSKKESRTPNKSQLSELIFVFLWAALWQIGVLITCILALLFGGDLPLAPPGMIPTHWAGLAMSLIVFFYALFLLVTVLQTLLQMSVVIISEERRKA